MPNPRIDPRRVLFHPAYANAAALFVALVSIWSLTRLVLTVLAWRALDAQPSVLFAVFGRGLAIDMLFAASIASFVLAVGAATHFGPRHPSISHVGRFVRLTLLIAFFGFVGIAEVLFWDEFDARFNFIAVDYLVYTTEVIGNIRESYPVAPLLAALLPAGALVAAVLCRIVPMRAQPAWRWPRRLIVVVLALGVSLLAARTALQANDAVEVAASLRADAYAQQLARNGPASFFAAYRDNELSFRRFYASIDDARAETVAGPWPRRGHLTSVAWQPDDAGAPKHVIVIEVESLSAAFLGVFGNQEGLTPNLDRLAGAGVSFTELYATGTRTVRGLEALSVALPPLPGQSIVRRPDNADLFTLGSLLREHGFETTFLYGGYGYFDNMNAFFAANGYAVRDRSDIPGERVGFANIWGIADEYLLDDAISWMDRATQDGHRQLLHVMTTSNHRPYTYPEGRIDIASKTGRRGAVKYTDWAIGHFIEAARTRPWFDDTLFVIVADHCASVAGKTRIPPQRYRIPAILYAPKYLAPREIGALSSQIDLAPTIVARLGVDDGGGFFGQDRFVANPDERAFISNYQEVGMLTPGEHGARDLVVLSPRRRVEQYRIGPDDVSRPVPVDSAKAERTIAEYQFADTLLHDRRYRPLQDRRYRSLHASTLVP